MKWNKKKNWIPIDFEFTFWFDDFIGHLIEIQRILGIVEQRTLNVNSTSKLHSFDTFEPFQWLKLLCIVLFAVVNRYRIRFGLIIIIYFILFVTVQLGVSFICFIKERERERAKWNPNNFCSVLFCFTIYNLLSVMCNVKQHLHSLRQTMLINCHCLFLHPFIHGFHFIFFCYRNFRVVVVIVVVVVSAVPSFFHQHFDYIQCSEHFIYFLAFVFWTENFYFLWYCHVCRSHWIQYPYHAHHQPKKSHNVKHECDAVSRHTHRQLFNI